MTFETRLQSSITKNVELAKRELDNAALVAKERIIGDLNAFQGKMQTKWHNEEMDYKLDQLYNGWFKGPRDRQLKSVKLFEYLCGTIMYKLYVDDL